MDDENGNWQLVIGVALGIAVTALAGGYLGWLHPFGDSLAVGRGVAAAAVMVIAVFARFAAIPDVVEHGLFLNGIDTLVIARGDTMEVRRRGQARSR